MAESSRMKQSKSVTEKNTKQEILEAYQGLLTQLENQEMPQNIVSVISKANKTVEDILRNETEQIKSGLDNSLNTLREQMEEVAKLLAVIQQAAEIQNKTLEQEKKRIEVDRLREQEEYDYQFNRLKSRQEEELKEEKGKFQIEIAAKYAEFKTKEGELVELKKQAELFETRLQKSVSETTEKVTKDLKTQYDYEKTLSDQQAKASQSLLEQKIILLGQTIASQQKEIERLNNSTLQANQQMTRIAERAVSKTTELQPQTSSNSNQSVK